MTRALAEERARYDELFELSPLGQIVTDRDGLILEANSAAAELWATSAPRLRGKPVSVFVPLEQRRDFRDRLLEASAATRPSSWTCEFLGRDGARVAAQVIVAATVGRDPVELRWVIRDVSDQHVHAERLRQMASEHEERFLERTAELEEQRSLLEAVIENIPAGLVVMGSDGKAVLANKEATRILGRESLDRDALGELPAAETRHLDGRLVQAHEWPLARTIASGEVVAGEKYELVSDGHHVILEIGSAPVVAKSGEQTGGVAVFRDVTTQEHSERAERDFVTNAAHELQSPLAAIVSAVEVLQGGAKDGPERDLFLGHIERESTRLVRLVTSLMVLARSQIGVEAPRDEAVGLCALFRDVGSTLRLHPGVELVIDCPEDLAVVTNRELVEQAVVNLAENAAKHTTSGKIVLGGGALPQHRVEISVADTGPGIPAAERARIFERFYRGPKSEGAGFGVGLAIVRAVADALEGELELDSRLGGGTAVRLRLPQAATLVTS